MQSENDKIALALRNVASELPSANYKQKERLAAEIRGLASRVEKLPSAYKNSKQTLDVPAGETSQDSIPLPITAGTLMVERSLDVPYETAYPISKR